MKGNHYAGNNEVPGAGHSRHRRYGPGRLRADRGAGDEHRRSSCPGRRGHHHLADRPAGGLRCGLPGRVRSRHRSRDQGHRQGRRAQAEHQLRRRRRGQRQGRHRRQGLHRQGLQDHGGHRLLRHRPRPGRTGGPEQGAVHLRPGRSGCDHGHQRLHLPLRTPDLPGRRDRRNLHRQPAGQEGPRLRTGHRVRPGQPRRRDGGARRPGRHRVRRTRPGGRDRVHARSRRRSATPPPTSSSSPGRAPPPERCGRRWNSRACSTRSPS